MLNFELRFVKKYLYFLYKHMLGPIKIVSLYAITCFIEKKNDCCTCESHPNRNCLYDICKQHRFRSDWQVVQSDQGPYCLLMECLKRMHYILSRIIDHWPSIS